MTAQDQQSRAEFEAHMRVDLPHANYTIDRDGDYQFGWMQAVWIGWQAARALPATPSASNAGGGEPVQMPEPVAKIQQGHLKWHFPTPASSVSGELLCGTHGLFTAAQVQAMGLVPPGWVAVPVGVSEEMKHAVMELLLDGLDIYVNGQDQIVIETDAPRRLWKSFLGAAPRPPAAQEEK